MSLTMFKSIIALTVLIASSPDIISTIAGIVAIIYFASVTKVNVVDVKHDGSWGKYFKSWLTYFKKK